VDGGNLTDAMEFGNTRRLMDWQHRYRDHSVHSPVEKLKSFAVAARTTFLGDACQRWRPIWRRVRSEADEGLSQG